ncbi:uncharacterized protein [Bombus flavifrons]|uniref:uncharacterized protein n=1 Tax=Bombus flavifrons TaxID=103934 RepID=UPI00370378DD
MFAPSIRTLKTARECWKALEDVHRRSTSIDIVLCMRELGTIEKTPSMDISTYCGRIHDLYDELSSVGIQIEDHVMACFLLAGLVADPNYATYLRTTRIDKDLTARVVKSDLLLEERRIDAAADSSEKNSAMAALETMEAQASTKQRWHEAKAQRPKVPEVWKRGHMSYHCQEGRGDKEEQNQRDKRERESEDKSRSKGLITALALSSISHMERDRISYLDSGASSHMTPDRHRFVDFVPATGQIRIGKGYLEIKGKGTIVVKMTKACGGWTPSLSNALWVPELDVNLISTRQLAIVEVVTTSKKTLHLVFLIFSSTEAIDSA